MNGEVDALETALGEFVTVFDQACDQALSGTSPRPRHGGLTECRRLLRRLQSQEVNDWLDRAIRCRHLTVGAVASIPWADSEGSYR